jgi:CDP-glucose 4,6-dehydratase
MESNVEKSYFGDINDDDCLQSALLESQPEIIFHLAAQPLVMDSYKDPIKTFETNIIGTARLILYSSQLESLKSLVNVTSDKCYANNNSSTAFLETDPMGGKDPYSASKGCAELISASLQSSFVSNTSIGLANVRAGNVIGGGDYSKNRLLPDIIRAMDSGETLIIRSPNAIRPWQHVLEPLFGYLEIAEKLYSYSDQFIGGWNFGPELCDCISVKAVLDIVSNCEANFSYSVQDQAPDLESQILRLDITKSKNSLKWTPKWSAKNAIEKTLDFHRRELNGEELVKIVSDQIQDYKEM